MEGKIVSRRAIVTSGVLAAARLTATPIGTAGLFGASGLLAQTRSSQVNTYTFEVASVRLRAVDSQAGLDLSGGPGTSDPGKINYLGIPMTWLLSRAYGIPMDMISGPNWLGTAKYDIAANVPLGTSKEHFALMLQNLLIERFKLICHEEERNGPGFDLGVASGGPTLKESVDGPESEQSPQGLGFDRDGFPKLSRGAHTVVETGSGGFARASFGRFSLPELAQWLRFRLGSPVLDRTGLTGRFDFTLEFAPTGMFARISPDDGVSGPLLANALEKQLGLKLERTKGPSKVLVIDHIEKTPTEN